MATTVATATHPAHHHFLRNGSDMLNTIPDPRSPSPAMHQASRKGSASTDSGHHPDLSAEVATLSTKLVNAINHQTDLDDSLQATRHELEAARETIARLQTEAWQRDDEMTKGLWVRRDEHESLRRERDEERKQRRTMEAEKKRIESELENLTTALFEEANTMVAAARKETEATERKNDQLKSQLQDTEILLASQQEQLHDLKVVVERMSERDDSEVNALSLTAPSTPGTSAQDKMARLLDVIGASPNTPGQDEVPPEHPLHFSHLIHPVLRTDLIAYREFTELLKQGKMFSAPSSRASSGNYGNINVLGLHVAASTLSNGSSTSLPMGPPSSAGSNGPTSPRTSSLLPPLKDSTFYKRALTEDIEPTLRLDQAPGVSWMGRRTVINSIASGALSVEPHPPIQKHRGPVFACALCGESRIADKYIRKWRFKTSEGDDAQRYPLCDWCMGRLRSTCDYVGFLRMVQAGHWRADTEEETKSAWEEAVRFRERMFWSRMGGGVVPAFLQKDALKSPTARPLERRSVESASGAESEDKTVREKALEKGDDPFEAEKEKETESHGGAQEREKDAPSASETNGLAITLTNDSTTTSDLETTPSQDSSILPSVETGPQPQQTSQPSSSSPQPTPQQQPSEPAEKPIFPPALHTPTPSQASLNDKPSAPPVSRHVAQVSTPPPKKSAIWDRIARFEKSPSPKPAVEVPTPGRKVSEDSAERQLQDEAAAAEKERGRPKLERQESSQEVVVPGAFA